jgi:glycerate 2-kinase
MPARDDALAIFRAGLRGADPRQAVAAALHRDETGIIRVGDEEVARVADGGRLYLLAAGKAAIGMARAAMEVLGDAVAAGVVVVPHALVEPVPPLEVFGAGHPLPDAGSLAAAGESLRVARALREGDLLLCLLSGGASALWAAPPAGVTLGDVRRVSAALQRAGAEIGELNTVRKQLSRIAGGRLARLARPARVVTLALSDVLGAPPETIGSAPTIAGSTGYADALAVLARYGVEGPSSVIRHLQRGAAGEIENEGMDGDRFAVVAGLEDALGAARAEAERLGYRAEVVSDRLAGEARAAGGDIVGFALSALNSGEGPRALLWGGETTVTVRGAGRGGRSQELALAAARLLEGEERVVILACGTDGIDGPTPAAGALVDGGTIGRARSAGHNPDDALAENDAYPLLRDAGDLVTTGPTGTNVGDVVVVLVTGAEALSTGAPAGG